MFIVGLTLMFVMFSTSAAEITHDFDFQLKKNCTVTQEKQTSTSPDGFVCTEYLRSSKCNASDPTYHAENEVGWPGKPIEMTVEPFETKFSDISYAAVKVTWKPPQDGSVKDLKGFEVTFMPLANKNGAIMNPTRQCRLLTVSNVTKTKTLIDTTFELYVLLSQEAYYFVHLYSLPKPDIDRDNSNLFAYMYFQARIQNADTALAPAYWLTSITVRNISSERKVEVGFTLAPKNFNFQSYKISIKDLDAGRNYQKIRYPDIESDSDSYTFTNVEDGRYDIQVEPKDPYRFQDGKCVCHDADNICQSCPVTNVSLPVIINGPGKATPTTSSGSAPKTVNTSKKEETVTGIPGNVDEVKVNPTDDNIERTVVGTIVGSLAAVVLCGLVLYILMRKRTQCRNGFSYWFKSHTTLSISSLDNTGFRDGTNNTLDKNERRVFTLQRKKIAFIFTEDHPCHKELVRYLAKYLQVYCHCDVLYPDWYLSENLTDGPIGWTLKSIDKADFTFIINSEAAYRLYKAWKEDLIYNAPLRSPRGDTFTPAISKIFKNIKQAPNYRRYIMISFDHTKKEHTLSEELTQGLKYQLTKHMKELLCHVHGLNYFQDDLSNIDLPLNGNYSETTEGQKLLEAMDKAGRYQRQNPYCFQNTFGDPVHKSRSDSGYSPDSAGSISDEEVATIRSECKAQLRNSMKKMYVNTRTNNNDDEDMLSIEIKDAISFYSPSELDNEMFQNQYMIGPTPTAYPVSRKTFEQQNSNESQGYSSQHDDETLEFEPPDPSVNIDAASRTISALMLQVNEKYNPNTNRPHPNNGDLPLYEVQECISLGGESV